MDEPIPVIGLVGPCTSGKSTLLDLLKRRGIPARHIAQEHSYVQRMWKVIANPDVLIYLDVTYPVSMRRKKLDWTEDEYLEQQRRLTHARAHADFYLMTDPLTPDEVLDQVLKFLLGKYPLLTPS